MSNENTIVETVQQEVPAVQPVTTQAPTSWKDSLSDDLKGLSTIQNISDINSLVKSYDSAQRMLGSSVRIPSEEASPEAKAEFYNKLASVPGVTQLPDPSNPESMEAFYSKIGRPADPNGYKLPEEINGKVDGESLANFTSMAHKLGLTNQQAAEIVKFDVARQQQLEEYMLNVRQEGESTLRAKWGNDYDARLQGAKEAAKLYSEKYPEAMNELVNGPTGNNPALLEILSETYATLKQAGTIIPSTSTTTYGLTPEEAKGNIKDILENKGHAYHNNRDPNHRAAVEKMSKLFEAAYPE